MESHRLYLIPLAFLLIGTLAIFFKSLKSGLPLRKKKQNSTTREKKFYQMISLMLDENYEDSLLKIKEIINAENDNPYPYLAAGKILFIKKEYARALKIFYNLSQHPFISKEIKNEALLFLVKIYKNQGDIEKAFDYCNLLLKKNPVHLPACELMLELLEKKFLWKEAYDFLQTHLKKEKVKYTQRASYYLTMLGEAEFILEKFPESLRNFEKALVFDKNNILAEFKVAAVFYKLGKFEKALSKIETLITKRSDYLFMAYPILEDCAFRLSKFNKIGDILGELIKKDDKNKIFIQLFLARFLKKRKNPEEAINILEDALNANPNYFEAKNELARTLLETANLKKIKSTFYDFLKFKKALVNPYHCNSCDSYLTDYTYKCPDCGAINSITHKNYTIEAKPA